MGIGISFAAVQFLVFLLNYINVHGACWLTTQYRAVKLISQNLGLHVKLDVDMHINMTEWWFT